MHPGQKLKVGSRVIFEGHDAVLHGEVVGRGSFGRRVIRLWTDAGPPPPGNELSQVDAAIDAIGHVPLPPYIKRDDRPADRERYQTVFAASAGRSRLQPQVCTSTNRCWRDLRERGVEIVSRSPCTSATGPFSRFASSASKIIVSSPNATRLRTAAAAAINRALDEDRRVIAVGTTTTRTLEAVAKAARRSSRGGSRLDRPVHLSRLRVSRDSADW